MRVILHTGLAIVCGLFVTWADIATLAADPPASESFVSAPRVILHQWGPTRARPSTLSHNLTELEDRLDGVDGLYLFLEETGFAVMSSKPLSGDAVRIELEPAAGISPKRLKYNFAIVYNDRPADLFDDWSVPIANWKTFAAECRKAGLVGIAFDNEQYFGTWSNYPEDCKYAHAKTLDDYREQAHKRGREVMEAIAAGFPEAVVVTFHGPTLSTAAGPEIVYNVPDHNELWGPFFAGMLEGSNKRTLLCDGGELYGLRTRDEFSIAYQWRKHGIASAQAAVPFIPETLRDDWKRVSLSWGLYDCKDEGTDRNADPTSFRATMAAAISSCDHFVWMYFEEQNLLEGERGPWHQAITLGKQDGLAVRQSARKSSKE